MSQCESIKSLSVHICIEEPFLILSLEQIAQHCDTRAAELNCLTPHITKTRTLLSIELHLLPPIVQIMLSISVETILNLFLHLHVFVILYTFDLDRLGFTLQL